MNIKLKLTRLVACVCLIGLSLVCAAQQIGTLEKIRASGAIKLGHAGQAIPFSYVNESVPIGYSIDICLKVVDSVRTELGLSVLDVKYLPVSGQSRFTALKEGKIDLECGVATNNSERQQLVSFAPTTFVAAIRFGSKKTSQLNTISDLAGKPVLVQAESTALNLLNQLNIQRGLGMVILPARTATEAFNRLDKGEAQAFVEDDVLLSGIFASSTAPEEYVVSAEALSVEPYGIMFRKNDDAFKNVVTKSVTALMQSGATQAIYDKWFLRPVPPRAVNLNLPISAALRRVMAQPTSSADPAYYR